VKKKCKYTCTDKQASMVGFVSICDDKKVICITGPWFTNENEI